MGSSGTPTGPDQGRGLGWAGVQIAVTPGFRGLVLTKRSAFTCGTGQARACLGADGRRVTRKAGEGKGGGRGGQKTRERVKLAPQDRGEVIFRVVPRLCNLPRVSWIKRVSGQGKCENGNLPVRRGGCVRPLAIR